MTHLMQSLDSTYQINIRLIKVNREQLLLVDNPKYEHGAEIHDHDPKHQCLIIITIIIIIIITIITIIIIIIILYLDTVKSSVYKHKDPYKVKDVICRVSQKNVYTL